MLRSSMLAEGGRFVTFYVSWFPAAGRQLVAPARDEMRKIVHLIVGPEQQKSARFARLSGRRPLPAPEGGAGKKLN